MTFVFLFFDLLIWLFILQTNKTIFNLPSQASPSYYHHTSVNRAGIVVLTIRYIISYFCHLWFIQQTQAAFCTLMHLLCYYHENLLHVLATVDYLSKVYPRMQDILGKKSILYTKDNYISKKSFFFVIYFGSNIDPSNICKF